LHFVKQKKNKKSEDQTLCLRGGGESGRRLSTTRNAVHGTHMSLQLAKERTIRYVPNLQHSSTTRAQQQRAPVARRRKTGQTADPVAMSVGDGLDTIKKALEKIYSNNFDFSSSSSRWRSNNESRILKKGTEIALFVSANQRHTR
jgi:hypothetical protein